jgi:hypothetical protein
MCVPIGSRPKDEKVIQELYAFLIVSAAYFRMDRLIK